MTRIEFFQYHSGNSKFLTIWFGLVDAANEYLTLKQFSKLAEGIQFSLDGSDTLYQLTKSNVIIIK